MNDDLTKWENNTLPHALIELSTMEEWEEYDIMRQDWKRVDWVWRDYED